MCPPSVRPISQRGPSRECHNCKTRNNYRSLRCYNCHSFVKKRRGRPRRYQYHLDTFQTPGATSIPTIEKRQLTNSVMSETTPQSEDSSPLIHQQDASSELPTSSESLSQPSTSLAASQSPQPLTDFMGMLKMRRMSDESDGSKGVNGTGAKKGDGERVKERNDGKEVEDMETESSSGSVQGTLVDRFKKDPNSVLQLLESALTMDKLGSLLSKHHRQDKKKVEDLRSKLEAAYHTLKECAQQKGVLTEKIQVTNEKIKAKRKQLESLREELKVLGEEELQLKRKRDTSYTNCADLKKKLKCSRDALQQLAVLAPAKNSSNSSTKGGTVGEGSQHT